MKFSTGNLLFVLSMILLKVCESVVQHLKIGAIFHDGDTELEAAFDEALSDLEDEQESAFRFIPVKKYVVADSWKTHKVLCQILNEGVVAVFGPTPTQTREVICRLLGRFQVPHLAYSWEETEINVTCPSLNLFPSGTLYENAIADVARHMNWNHYTFLYQTYDALSRIRETLEKKGLPSHHIIFKNLPTMYEISQMSSEKERDLAYEKVIKKIQLLSQSTLLIDVETNNLETIMDKMKKMGLISDYFMALIVSLDSQRIDMRPYISNTVANITQLQLIKDGSNDMSIEAALLYDAVFVLSDALTILSRDGKKIRPKPIDCWNGDERFDMGPKILTSMKKRTKSGRKTGLMIFSEEGEREFELDIINTQAGRTVNIGSWTKDGLVLRRNEREMNDTLSVAAKAKVFRVSTRIGSPYITLVEDENKKGRLIGDRKFVGYCIDLIEKIEQFLGIKCEFEIVPDGNYGSKNPRTKQWNGLLRQLLDHKADLALCDLTITSERQSAVDFTAPFMNLGISILFSKSEKVVPKLFSFMDPFSTEVWMYMSTAYLVVSLILFFAARIAPEEWQNPHPCNSEPEELENNFNIMNCLWLTMGSLMQQGSDILPVATSTRLLVGMWWFFVLIMVSSYTANLAAFLTAVKMEESINDVEDLAKQTKIAYGALKDGSTYSFFKNSNTSLYQRIFNTMADAKPSVFTKTNDEGVERVIKGRRKYAFFMESTAIEYQMERHCELQMVGNLLDNKGYGIALPPNSPYRTMISTAILHLQEKGELQDLKQKWWKEEGGGLCDDESDEPVDSNKLGMAHVGGVFLVLMFGCGVSILMAIIEFLWSIRGVAIEEKITPKEALIKELKFLIDVSATVKKVKKSSAGSSKSSSRSNRKSSAASASVNASIESSSHRLEIDDTPLPATDEGRSRISGIDHIAKMV